MNKVKQNKILPLVFLLALLPALAFAQSTAQAQLAAGQTSQTSIGVPQQGFSGIFSCNQTGANAMSVGALGATGGVYVPVADASVELNTGTLVYKECVLREVVDAQRQAETAGITQNVTAQVLSGHISPTGQNQAEFIQQQTAQFVAVQTAAIKAILQNGVSTLDPKIQSQVKQAIAQGFAVATNNPSAMLVCVYPGATTDFTSSNPQGNIWNDILAVASPCNPLFGYIDANNLANGYAAQEQNCLQNQLLWGGGFFAVTTGNGGPCEQQIVTPSSEVNGLYSQVLQSPYNQLQNANDIGQMVGPLFAGISSQVLSANGGGITGIDQTVGGNPSYLAQAVTQESQNLQSTIANTALVNLDSALQIEESYYNIMTQIASSLEYSVAQLRGSEAQCFQNIVQAVCAPGSLLPNGTCTAVTQCTTDATTGQQDCPQGATLHIATSSIATEFSQPLIAQQIAALASTTAQNINTSQQALDLINSLIQNVTGGSSDAQGAAVAQLNALVASNQLHMPSDITAAQTQEQSVETFLGISVGSGGPSLATTGLVPNAITLWAGTNPLNTASTNIPWNGSVGATLTATSPGVGWCNSANQTTLQQWEKIWTS